MSELLGRPITYALPWIAQFIARHRREGTPLGMALVMTALYSVQRFGGAAEVTDDLARL
ncbi:hypothetical protein [Pararhodobacter sp. SW119]|uniref:hypothetical protein n=1 Tax=Pararhodobacter sp. SW119 TaxID=2780075 RepID=UPI001AE08F4C|nr:hypothetical protein [Pararhodobacter sp. SW119]